MVTADPFRRLILDTVAVAISKPPSASALIELLRIASPNASLTESDVTSQDSTKRDKLFKTLKLRIHPDKHPGDESERVTELYQNVGTFYDKCVAAGRTSTARASTNSGTRTDTTSPYRSSTSNDNNKSSRQPQASPSPANSNTNTNGAYYGANQNNNRGFRPSGYNPYPHGTKHSDPIRPTHDSTGYYSNYNDYVSYADHQKQRQQQNKIPRTIPPSRYCFTIISILAFFPIGLCALMQSYKVKSAWNEGRHADALDHSTRAYRYACYAYLFGLLLLLYFWLRDGDHEDFDFDKWFDFDFDKWFD